MAVLLPQAPVVVDPSSTRPRQTWPVPVEQGYLQELLTHLFSHYWSKITYGPILHGAAFEFTCPSAPTSIELLDEFLTIRFGHDHFHLCLGPSTPLPSDVKPPAHHPKLARFFRQLDPQGAPIAWGFEMFNYADQPMLTIDFDSPFATHGDQILSPPEWHRLDMWRAIAQRYLQRSPEVFDESGKGFVDGNF